MQTYIKTLFVFFILVLTFSTTISVSAQTNNEKFVVVLDAGHGGHDPGKPSKYGKEKDIALKIVLALGKALSKHLDIKVIYTRKTDVFVDLFKRGKIANKANADLFVSIHCNAHNTQAYGAETYVLGIHRNQTNFNVAKFENEVIFLEKDYKKNYEGYDPSSPESFIGLTLMQEEYLDQSIQLAKNIQYNFTHKLKRKNRGVKQAGFIVLHQTVMPSVLVETGFLTHSKEGKYLNSNKGQQELALAMKKAIVKYKKGIEDNTGEFEYDTVDEVGASSEAKVIKNTIFKVQIAAGSKKIEPKSYNFKGLKDISREKKDGLYKYYYGYTSDYNKAQKLQSKAKKKGYKDCYLVAFKNGKRISLEKALKQDAN